MKDCSLDTTCKDSLDRAGINIENVWETISLWDFHNFVHVLAKNLSELTFLADFQYQPLLWP